MLAAQPPWDLNSGAQQLHAPATHAIKCSTRQWTRRPGKHSQDSSLDAVTFSGADTPQPQRSRQDNLQKRTPTITR
jgi:hypothetical protein